MNLIQEIRTFSSVKLHRDFKDSRSRKGDRKNEKGVPLQGLTASSVHTVAFALSFVQYRTCKVPLVRPGKKSAICFHVRFLFSFSSMSKLSSVGVNFSFGPRGRGAGDGMPGCPTTLSAPGIPGGESESALERASR